MPANFSGARAARRSRPRHPTYSSRLSLGGPYLPSWPVGSDVHSGRRAMLSASRFLSSLKQQYYIRLAHLSPCAGKQLVIQERRPHQPAMPTRPPEKGPRAISQQSRLTPPRAALKRSSAQPLAGIHPPGAREAATERPSHAARAKSASTPPSMRRPSNAPVRAAEAHRAMIAALPRRRSGAALSLVGSIIRARC